MMKKILISMALILLPVAGNSDDVICIVGDGCPNGNNNNWQWTANHIPEPGSMGLLGLGALTLLICTRKKRK